jgi:hypothetical protein
MKIKTKGRNNSLFLIFLIIVMTFSFFSIPTFQTALPIKTADSNDVLPSSSQIIPRNVRIAIYDEPNVTQPGYTSGNTLTNNYTALILLLESAGFDVTTLTCADIYNHALMTADFDIFILVDNVPRENITNHVKEFWLGGGGILSFDSALPYLCYAGIIIPESEGDDGRLTYWTYQSGTDHNISMRHPITKDYQVNDKYSTGTWMNHFYWSVVQGTSVGSEIVRLSNRVGSWDAATAVALRRSDIGGPIVHLPGTANIIGINMSSLITDAIDWVCPRPKGRILFDLSHHSFYGIDSWDDVVSSTNYGIWRNTLVSRGYTIDKLYPSATGNLTTSNLLPYDMLFLCIPEYNFTANEVTAVTQWVDDGGGLIAIGEHSGFADENNNINYLYGNYDLKMVSVTGTSGATYFVEHPTTEGCTEISASGPGTINYSGDAFPIWGYDATEISVAGQEYGNGRVLLMSDVGPFRDTNINSLDNLQYAINVANWLTTSEAEVLLYVDEPDSPNHYRTPVSNALNELGINFYLTFDDEYMNLSLNLYDWELLIIDNPWFTLAASVLTTVNNFVKGGDRLIMSTYHVDSFPTHPLWARLGFAYDDEQPDSSSLYIWDTTHAIFNLPVDYGATKFDPFSDYGDEGDLLRVHPNATSLAGYTASETENNTNLVLGNGGKTLFNGYLIDQFTGDLDDSTYADNFELWVNEIAFMWAQITAEPPGTPGGIPGYNMFLVSIAIVFSIGVISVLKIRKIRKI